MFGGLAVLFVVFGFALILGCWLVLCLLGFGVGLTCLRLLF